MTDTTETDDREADEYGRPALDDDEVIWQVSLKRPVFSTEMIRDEDVSGDQIEREARQQFIDAIRTGDVDLRWQKTVRDADTVRGHRDQSDAMRCPRCDHVNMGEWREIDVDSDLYEIDFDFDVDGVAETGVDGNRYISVCRSCRKAMWENAHADAKTDTEEADA